MTDFKHISIHDAKTLMDTSRVTLIDIRDELSFSRSRIAGAAAIDNSNLQQFIETNDLDKPLIVYCYHGNSSQSAAQFLCEKGFEDVYSLDGGFELWRNQYPIEA